MTLGPALFATVTLTGAAVLVLPAASRAIAVSVWPPFATVVVVQLTEYGGVVSSWPRLEPFNLNCTPATPALSDALAETATVPETVAPAPGAVSATAGALVSGAAVVVNVSCGDTVRFPHASREATRK